MNVITPSRKLVLLASLKSATSPGQFDLNQKELGLVSNSVAIVLAQPINGRQIKWLFPSKTTKTIKRTQQQIGKLQSPNLQLVNLSPLTNKIKAAQQAL